MQVIESQQQFERELHRAGLRVSPYLRGPLGAESFCLSLSRENTVRFWLGAAQVEFDVDRKLRQVVVAAHEKERQITRTYSVSLSSSTEYGVFIERARGLFPVTAAGMVLGDVEILDTDAVTEDKKSRRVVRPWRDSRNRMRYNVRVRCTGTIPEGQPNHLLIGFDENSQFISVLPKRAETVAEAHQVLRPKGISDKAKRQGEWFFDPVSKAVATKIEKHIRMHGEKVIETNRSLVIRRPRQRWVLADQSSHHARKWLQIGKVVYVSGEIYDTRLARHKPLNLGDTWHRVVRNAEVDLVGDTVGQRTTPVNRVAQSTRYFD